MHQGGGLQGVVRPFLSHVALRQPMQVVIDQGHELLVGALVAFARRVKQLGDTCAGGSMRRTYSGKATISGGRQVSARLGKRAIDMVSAWAEENHLVLGQRKVDEKSNGITAIPELLKMLALSGCIVTIDAKVVGVCPTMGTQREIAQSIQEAEADYLLSVKENQGHLYEDLSMLFGVDQELNFKYTSLEHAKTTSKGHGRIEVRECWCTSHSGYLKLIRNHHNWAGLKSIAMIISTRIIDGVETRQVRYYISSLPSNAQRILQVCRRHWAIENELHWVLDVAMQEDHSRVRKDQAPENLAVLRHIALNLLKQEKTAKVGIHGKQLQAALREDYLLKVLADGN